ncbi:MAG: GNAT family N-acetyltransferase, partial [Vulcanimicrobiaceae bacterium]
ALANEDGGASRTYVLCAAGRVIAYYALAMGDVALQTAVMVLGRLAVDKAYQGKGLGRALLRDAVLRTLQAAALGGIQVILVHAISDEAKRFYASCGFAPSPLDPMTLMITVADAEKALTG